MKIFSLFKLGTGIPSREKQFQRYQYFHGNQNDHFRFKVISDDEEFIMGPNKVKFSTKFTYYELNKLVQGQIRKMVVNHNKIISKLPGFAHLINLKQLNSFVIYSIIKKYHCHQCGKYIPPNRVQYLTSCVRCETATICADGCVIPDLQSVRFGWHCKKCRKGVYPE